MKGTLKGIIIGSACSMLILLAANALAGTGVGGIFNLGQGNTVDAQTSLTGNPGGNPLLKVTSTGTAAAVRGVATNGIGTNGVSTSGVGQQGLSNSGIGTLGTHGNTTGTSPGVQGETNSTDPAGAGVVGKNTGGGPGLRTIVNAGAPPLAVNSPVKVANLNADLLDGIDSTGLVQGHGTLISPQLLYVANDNGSASHPFATIPGYGQFSVTCGTREGGPPPATLLLQNDSGQTLDETVIGNSGSPSFLAIMGADLVPNNSTGTQVSLQAGTLGAGSAETWQFNYDLKSPTELATVDTSLMIVDNSGDCLFRAVASIMHTG